jgi:transposase
LFPHLAGVTVERVFLAGRSVRIQASTRAAEVSCPACGTVSGHVHSRYERRLLDTAAGGQETMIHLRVRRFFCRNEACGKKTFAEQVPGLTTRYGRWTNGLADALRAVALALGGRAGARLAGRLAAGVSRMTLIRLIRALPDPALSRAPDVLGVDEFALRRGRCYGTLLVDVRTRRPVDILADRSADSFAAWLAAHPGTQIVCRDRAGCYADGAARGAPEAIQVADRWHLWHNLGDAVERAVARHRHCLAAAIPATTSGPSAAAAAQPRPGGRQGKGRIAERTRQRHAAIHQRLAEGQSLAVIAAELGLARNTVRRFARATDPGELLVNDWSSQRPHLLDEYAPYLHERWDQGCTDAAQLWREIRAHGYRGSYTLVRDHLAPLRLTTTATTAPAAKPPKARKVTSWIMTHPDNLTRGARRQLTAILAACPDLAAVQKHVSAFADLMTQRRGRDLEKWITVASSQPQLRSFAEGLHSDQDAVTAGLTLPWNSGVVEGHVNRIKMLKRQMYGRANPDLLRRRILLAD